MVKVIMNVSIASADFSYYPQQEVELEDSIARAWETAGHCTILKEPPKRGDKNASKSK